MLDRELAPCVVAVSCQFTTHLYWVLERRSWCWKQIFGKRRKRSKQSRKMQ